MLRRAPPLLAFLVSLALTAASFADDAADAPTVVICGPHDRALVYWMAAVASGRLPREGVTVVHVDAHPDLSLPSGPFARGWRNDANEVLEHTHIASFQLAAVRMGLVDEIVWLRPRWAETFPDGPRTFQMGEVANGELGVDDESDHYVLDEGYAPAPALRDTQPVRFRVLPLEDAAAAGLLAESPLILDIDLDVFATRNPYADRLRSAGFSDADLDALRAIFAPAGLALSADPATRIAEVRALTEAVTALGAGAWTSLPRALWVFWQRGVGPGDLASLYAIVGRASASGAPLDALLEDARQVIGLPERSADPAEIAATAQQIRALLESGALRPALITIARSVDDGFTPRASWPLIEWSLLLQLQAVLPPATVIRFDDGLRPAPRPAGGVAPIEASPRAAAATP